MQPDLLTLLNHSGGFNDGLIAIFPCFIRHAHPYDFDTSEGVRCLVVITSSSLAIVAPGPEASEGDRLGVGAAPDASCAFPLDT